MKKIGLLLTLSKIIISFNQTEAFEFMYFNKKIKNKQTNNYYIVLKLTQVLSQNIIEIQYNTFVYLINTIIIIIINNFRFWIT